MQPIPHDAHTPADNIANALRNLLSETEAVESGDFNLDLTGFKSDREEANAR